MVASIRATATYRGSSSASTFTVPIPDGTVAGDLILFPFLVGASAAATNDHVSKGWWRYNATAVNTRSWAIFARIYIPTMRSTYAAAAVITFMTAWNNFLWPKVILLDNAYQTMPMLISNLSAG